MKSVYGIISKLYSDNNNIYIECDKIVIYAPIINGNVKINIIDFNNNNIGINGIKLNDSIKIFYNEKNNKLKPIQSIKIIKINNYTFNSDSSSSDDILI